MTGIVGDEADEFAGRESGDAGGGDGVVEVGGAGDGDG